MHKLYEQIGYREGTPHEQISYERLDFEYLVTRGGRQEWGIPPPISFLAANGTERNVAGKKWIHG